METKEFKRRLYKFVLELIKIVDALPKGDTIGRRLGDQLFRSGTSILGNYIEGQAASSTKDLINYRTNSLKSSRESILWFSLLKDSKRVSASVANSGIHELQDYVKIFSSAILGLKVKNKKGRIEKYSTASDI